jgi:hypothetical protein
VQPRYAVKPEPGENAQPEGEIAAAQPSPRARG